MEPDVKGGVDRSHGASTTAKGAFIGLHFLSVVLCAWIAFGGGVQTIGGWFGRTWVVLEPARATLVFLAAALYFVRHAVTLFYLIVRRVNWSEALGLSAFVMLVEVGLCLLATGITRSVASTLGPLDYFAVLLVLAGSYINTGSEVQRKWWKKDPANKGHCYTGGLFRYAAHINYFGDCLMFTGWCLLTGILWTLGVAAAMVAMFIFMHIPALDRYLEGRYGDEFRDYRRRTKKLIPWVY